MFDIPRPDPATLAYHAAAAAHEDARIEREAYLMAWGVRFDVDTLRRHYAHALGIAPDQTRDLAIMSRALVIADTITDEKLIAAGFPARARRTAA